MTPSSRKRTSTFDWHSNPLTEKTIITDNYKIPQIRASNSTSR
ncbi:MAG: DUF6434 domain-containing protein [Burkholderiaceae bacterium]